MESSNIKKREVSEESEIENIDDFYQVGQKKEPQKEVIEKPVYFDERQYSFKIPPIIIEALGGYDKKDKIRFTIVRGDSLNTESKDIVKIEYIKNGKKQQT